jgi:hypothetical protein
MTTDDEQRTRFLFGAPVEDPHCWELDLEQFARSLCEGFPQADSGMHERGGGWLSMWAETDDGVEFAGLADVTGRDTVLVENLSAAEASRFVVWLRAAIVPEGRPIAYNSEAGVDAGFDERDWLMPEGADRAGIEAALRGHLEEVLARIEEDGLGRPGSGDGNA